MQGKSIESFIYLHLWPLFYNSATDIATFQNLNQLLNTSFMKHQNTTYSVPRSSITDNKWKESDKTLIHSGVTIYLFQNHFFSVQKIMF